MWVGTRREVGPNGSVIGPVERAEHERSSHFPDGVACDAAWAVRQTATARATRMPGTAAHGRLLRPLGSSGVLGHELVAHVVPPSIERRIAISPSRIRLLTVPSGVSVRTAISCWVSPPK